MQAWREDTRARLRLERRQRPFAGAFAHDAARYLRAVAALPTISDRRRDIARWIGIFGQADRATITAADIRAARDYWLTHGRRVDDPRPPAPATVNKWLRALSNLYRVLDGPRAPNPVRDVPELQEPGPRDRAIDYATIAQILETMPDHTRAERGKKRQPGSRARAIAAVLAYTGWTPRTYAQITAADLDLERRVATLPDRRKGKGAASIVAPLIPQAVAALRAAIALDALGPFDVRAVNRSFRRAAARHGLPHARLYDLRHSYATLIASSGDERAAQYILQHGDIRTTRRYTGAGVPARVALAVAHVATVLPPAEPAE